MSETNPNNEDMHETVAIKVTTLPYHNINANDGDVEGVYIISFNTPKNTDEAAGVALAILHSQVPIKMPDTFDFEVVTMDDDILDEQLDEDYEVEEPYAQAGAGYVADKLSLQSWNEQWPSRPEIKRT